MGTQSAASVAEEILRKNDEVVRGREQLAQARLEAQLKPVADTLLKFQEQVTAVEKQRAEETGGLKEQIAQMLQAATATQDEARKLSSALRRGAGVQGRWGEQTLRNVLEAAGLSNRYDFDEQTSTDTDEGRRRPDVTVRLPGGALFVIDAKCSLNAFLEIQEGVERGRTGFLLAFEQHGDADRQSARRRDDRAARLREGQVLPLVVRRPAPDDDLRAVVAADDRRLERRTLPQRQRQRTGKATQDLDLPGAEGIAAVTRMAPRVRSSAPPSRSTTPTPASSDQMAELADQRLAVIGLTGAAGAVERFVDIGEVEHVRTVDDGGAELDRLDRILAAMRHQRAAHEHDRRQPVEQAELAHGVGDVPLLRISVFMSVFNCHVNRSPVAGRIERIAYRPGKFINAELDKA
eukprot:gene299-419_t